MNKFLKDNQFMKYFLFLIALLFVSQNIHSQSGWPQQVSGTSSTLLGAIMPDLNTAYGCGIDGIVLKSTNGGSNWFPLTTGTPRFLRSITYVTSNTIYTAGELGIILKTTNGGSNWISLNSGTNNTFVHIYFSDSLNGTAVGLN